MRLANCGIQFLEDFKKNLTKLLSFVSKTGHIKYFTDLYPTRLGSNQTNALFLNLNLCHNF
jgi:hypothetical protein